MPASRPAISRSPFNVRIAYADESAAGYAMWIYRRLVDRLREEFDFSVDLWSFTALERPEIWKLTSDDLAEATMVMMSFGATHTLAPSMYRWVETWLAMETPLPRALVVLGDKHTGPTPASSVFEDLQRLAAKANVQFFLSAGEWPGMKVIPPVGTQRRLSAQPRENR